MPALIVLIVLIGVPVLELFVLIEVGADIGAWATIGLVILTAVVGLTLVRIQGLSILTRAQRSLADDKMPIREVVDGVFLVIAGAMLLFPGFITDAVGFLLLIPPIRRGLGIFLFSTARRSGQFRAWAVRPGGQSGETDVIDGEYEDVSTKEPQSPERQLDHDRSPKGKGR